MSVSSRSPTTIGSRAPLRCTDSRCIAGSGLPVTCGSAPVAARTTPTSAPLPGSDPRTDGIVRSRFVATHQAPRRTATAASASSRQPTSAPYPCTTAAGSSSALATTLKPRAAASRCSPSPPTTSTGAPAGSRSASTWQAAWDEVDDLGRVGLDAHAAEQVGDRLRRPRGVVGHEGQPHPRRTRRGERLRRAVDRGRSQVDDAVQVEQGDVVASRRLRHRLAASAARAPRSAVE